MMMISIDEKNYVYQNRVRWLAIGGKFRRWLCFTSVEQHKAKLTSLLSGTQAGKYDTPAVAPRPRAKSVIMTNSLKTTGSVASSSTRGQRSSTMCQSRQHVMLGMKTGPAARHEKAGCRSRPWCLNLGF
jgi:hypothetical protein